MQYYIIQFESRPAEGTAARCLYSRTVIQLQYSHCGLFCDRLCGLVVRVSGYRYRGPGFHPRRYQIFRVVVGLERGPLSLVRSIEELLE